MTKKYDLFTAPGKVRSLLKNYDWTDHPFGKPDDWPSSLHTAIAMMLDAKMPSWVCCGPAKHLLYNDAYIDILGSKHPVAMGKPLWEIWPEIESMFKIILDKAFEGEGSFLEHLEFNLLRQGHVAPAWFTFSATPIRMLDGSVIGVFGAAVETTDQIISKRNETEESHRLRGMFQQAPGFIAVLEGPDHVFELANDAYYRLVGQRNLIGRPVRTALPEIADQGYVELLNQVYETGTAYIGAAKAVKLQRRENREPDDRFVNFILQPIVNADNIVTGIFIEGNDVTDQHKTQERIAFQLKMADLLRPLASPDDIVSTAIEMLAKHLGMMRVLFAEVDDEKGTFYISREWTRSGFGKVSGESRRLDDFGADIISMLRRGKVVAVDDVARDERTAASRQAYADINIRSHLAIPLVRSGQLAVILGLHQEVPFRWTSEAISLAQDMAERTWAAVERARSEQEKISIEKELRKANQHKDDFLAMLAHELRNPLAPICTAAELLKFAKLDDDQVRLTSEIISRQVHHMTGLVDDLLDVSRVTRGLVSLDMKVLDLAEIISIAVEQVRPLLETKKHILILERIPQPLRVRGDAKRLVQVITNLLNNAAKYTPEGGTIKVETELKSGNVLIHVIDNGIGISASLMKEVFGLFTQAFRTSDRSQGGLGLGLALVKNLVELQNGRVIAASEGEGRGTTFTVSLPHFVEEDHVRRVEVDNTAKTKLGRSLRLLVVDDNEDAADMLAMFMKMSGHEVFVEYEPSAALSRARLVQPHACIIDIGLPGMDGNELARQLRALPETSKSILVALTGYGQQNDRELSLRAGFDHYFVKPTDPTELESAIAGLNN